MTRWVLKKSTVRLSTLFSKDITMKKLIALYRDDSGVTAIEYGLIAALIAVVIISAVQIVGQDLQAVFNTVAGKLSQANNSAN
jgi:Flp pilus assembly pilin Flp